MLSAIGFCFNSVTDKSPVEYRFIKTKTQVFIQNNDG